MFKTAIVKVPCTAIVDGLTTLNIGKPDYNRAKEQHKDYVNALKECGLDVVVMGPDEKFPDSTFIEDTAVLTEKCAVITIPRPFSRRGEEKKVEKILKYFYRIFEYISPPGTLEGGDVMRVEDHFYVGISSRTNLEGANQLINILQRYGYTGSTIMLENMLHLKSGVAYMGKNNLLAVEKFKEEPAFSKFNIIPVCADEAYSANSILINDCVLVPKGFENTKRDVEKAGYKTRTLDVSEFMKLEGGLSCLSLRF